MLTNHTIPSPSSKRDRDLPASYDDPTTEDWQRRMDDTKYDMKEIRNAIIGVMADIEHELSEIEDDYWHPEDLDTDKIRSLILDAGYQAEMLRIASEAWRECEDEILSGKRVY